MKFCARKTLIMVAVFSVACGANLTYAIGATASPTPMTATESAHSNLLVYLDGVLREAGFSDACREYLTSIAKLQLMKITAASYEDDKRTLKRNLSMFFESLAEKNPASSDVIRNQYAKANHLEQPYDYILSTENLAYFKSNHVFDKLTVEDIKAIYSKFCPFWPFCEK